jgi:hypothetical protein
MVGVAVSLGRVDYHIVKTVYVVYAKIAQEIFYNTRRVKRI